MKSKNFGKKMGRVFLRPDVLLRLGLALVFFWAGFRIIEDPVAWSGYLPLFMKTIVPVIPSTVAIGVGDIILGVWLASGFAIRLAAFLSFLHLCAILIFSGIDDVVFRDIGLAFAALALFFYEET